MKMMTGMRKPTEKIQGQSLPEIRDWLDDEWKRLVRLKPKVTIGVKGVRAGTLLNAIVLHYASLSEESREQIARAYLKRYRSMQDQDKPQPVAGPQLVRASGGNSLAPVERRTDILEVGEDLPKDFGSKTKGNRTTTRK